MIYSTELTDKVLYLYGLGRHLNVIGSYECMPCRRTIERWRKKYPEFDQEIDAMNEQHTDALIVSAYQEVMKEPKTMVEAKAIDTRQRFLAWLAGRLNRKKYGDKLEVALTKKIDISPILANAYDNLKKVSVANPPQLTDVNITDIT